MTVFPSVTEIFVYGDLQALRKAGHEVGVFHFIDGQQEIWQEDAAALRDAVVRGGRLISWAAIGALLSTALRQPLRLISTLGWIAAKGGETAYVRLKTLAILPKCVLFARDCRRWKADQVHATWANHAAVAGLVIERLTGIPFSVSAHAGQDVFRDPVMLRDKVRAARFVAGCNSAVYQRLCELGGSEARDKLHHVPHGVRLDRFPFRERRTVSEKTRRVLFVGRFHPAKGAVYLVEAARLLRDEGWSVQVDLLGDGPEAEAVRAAIEAGGLAESVKMHGSVSQSVVAEHLARADVLALPSHVLPNGARDGLPNVVLEAMASGVPVVASRVASVEEAVEDGVSGLLVPQRDAPALAAAMRRVFEDGELAQRLAREGRRVVAGRFDREVCTRRFVELFERGAASP